MKETEEAERERERERRERERLYRKSFFFQEGREKSGTGNEIKVKKEE